MFARGGGIKCAAYIILGICHSKGLQHGSHWLKHPGYSGPDSLGSMALPGSQVPYLKAGCVSHRGFSL